MHSECPGAIRAIITHKFHTLLVTQRSEFFGYLVFFITALLQLLDDVAVVHRDLTGNIQSFSWWWLARLAIVYLDLGRTYQNDIAEVDTTDVDGSQPTDSAVLIGNLQVEYCV